MAFSKAIKSDTSVMGILALTLPISFAKLIPELNYLFNAIFLGQLGTIELAAVGITGVYYLIFSAIGYGLNNSLITIMSRRAGSGETDKIASVMYHGIFLSMVLALIFISFTLLFIDDMLLGAGIALDEVSISSSFLKIRIFGLIPLYCFQMCTGLVISISRTRLLMIVVLFSAFSNIFLDYSMIFGNFGFPKLGFDGAAYASVISEAIGFIVVLLMIVLFKLMQKSNISTNWKFDLSLIKLIWKQGLPLMSQYAISIIAWWFFFIMVSRNYDHEAQAISQSMRNIFGLSGVFSWAFGSATNTIISNVIGQGKEHEVGKIITKISTISCTGMVILVILLNIWPETFLGLYGQPPTFMVRAYEPLRIVSIAMVLLVFGVIWLNAVVASGKTQIVFYIELVGILAYLLYNYLAMEVYKLSISAAWLSEWIYWSVLFLLSFWYIKSDRWKGNVI